MRHRGHVRLFILAAAGHAGLVGSQPQATLPQSHSVLIQDPVLTSTACNVGICSTRFESYAAVDFTSIEILYDEPAPGYPTYTFEGQDTSRLKIVPESMTSADAVAGACLTSSLGESYVQGDWTTSGVETSVDTTISSFDTLRSAVGLRFEMGGLFKLCYSRNGTFEANDADVVPVPIRANGVYDNNCTTHDCLKTRRYECYLRKDAFSTATGLYDLVSSCAVDYSYDGAGFEGEPGRATWTAEFSASMTSGGQVDGPVTTQTCPPGVTTATGPADFICRNGGACDAGDSYITPAASADHKQLYFPTASDQLTGDDFRPRTVAACYCPDRSSCNTRASFVQQVGVMHYYLSKICHVLDTNCENDFTGIVPQYAFRVRIECPTDACQANDLNRLKIVESDYANDLPSWSTSPASGCGVARHGILGTSDVLPQRTSSVGNTINPPNCNGPLDCSLGGGSRQDYKEFGGAGGFQFVLGDSHHEARRFHEPKFFDVCFCNGDCDVQTSWFKAGQIRLSPTRLVSAATSKSTSPSQMSIAFLNAEGTIGLSRPYADAGTLGLNEGAVLKMLSDPDKVVGDVDCAENGYDPTVVDGLSSQVSASLNYRASLQTQTPADPTKLVFNSNSFVNVAKVKQPGTIAICYCAITVDSVCVESMNWKLVTHMTIRGPRTLQQWRFSTNIAFRFEYHGFGLTSRDSLRLISSDGSCTDNNGDPNSADYSYTAIQVKCPESCTDVTLVDGAEPGDVTTMVLSSDHYNCDTQNTACSTNDISSIQVLSETETELHFDHDPGLLVGEEITLGANFDVDCSDHIDNTSCLDEKEEQLATLSGVYDFADLDTKTSVAPSTYMSVHKITYVSGKILRIALGWPSPSPKFYVKRANANLAIGYIGRGGQWTHRSRAMTKEEIKGTKEKANLRVCWQYEYGGHGARYVEEVGRLTIVAPTTMLGASLTLTSTLYNQGAPAILTFKTGTGVTGIRYQEAEGSLRLTFVITDSKRVDADYTDGSAVPDVITVGDKDDARQSTCGQLFLELWSDDSERGFPMPKGCYYESFASGSGFTRRITMLFEGRSGLNKDTTYQVVFNSRVYDTTLQKGAVVMELFTMDDVINKPYEAIEYGQVHLATQPRELGTGTSDPRFKEPDGFKIVGGHEQLLQLRAADNLRFEVMGGKVGNVFKPIATGQQIRIFLWPLTQWETASVCRASCFDLDKANFVCGEFPSCSGQPVVTDSPSGAGMNNNMLVFTLPEMEPVLGSAKVKIEISGLTIPAGGFFASRLAAQVSEGTNDLYPHYVTSVGDYIWKEPNEGHPVSKVMSGVGGGNAKPFHGDQDNVLYARLLLASTIMAQDNVAGSDASFTVTLPPGYRCLDKQGAAAPGINTWAAEDSLPALAVVPQGRGTPSVPDGSPEEVGWNVSGTKCIFTPEHPNGVVYAGSSLIIKITVSNPDQALQRSDITNLWTVKMTGKGKHPTVQQTTAEYPFVANQNEKYYQTNVAVLGVIKDTFCQPTDLAPQLAGQPLYLRIFFRPESQVESGGLVRVVAPEGYVFGSFCLAMDLEDTYYAADASGDGTTLPLPGIVSCTSNDTLQREADISMANILRPGRLYGFKLRVQEAGTPLPQTEGMWNIYTADSSGYLIDGTKGSMSCAFGSGQFWGARRSSTLLAKMNIQDMRPSEMTGACTQVVMNISRVPSGNYGNIHFFAPEGYVWDLNGCGFSYTQAPFPSTPTQPTAAGRVLTWNSAVFSNTKSYAFSAPVRVPPKTPTSSSHQFFLQLGTRAAAALDANLVKALKNAAVDYTSTVPAKENALQFQVETVTNISAEGGLTVLAAAGFGFEATCEVTAVLDPTAPEPPDLLCTSSLDTALQRYRIKLQVPPGGHLGRGVHFFSVVGENPQDPFLNYPTADTPCGTSACWSFDSYENLNGDDAFLHQAVKLDHGTAAQGFSIRAQMYEGMVPEINIDQRFSTGRDDRPLMPNSVIFGFQVIEDMTGSMDLILRGPHGFLFEENCLPSVRVNQSTVFGVGSKFPPEYTIWPSHVLVTSCTGDGADANLTMKLDSSATADTKAFTTGNLYVLRIGLTNPQETPAQNYWTIELAPTTSPGQSSSRFPGMTLWALTNTEVSVISTSRVQYGDEVLRNPVTMNFRPRNTLQPTGYIKVEAPKGFTFVHLSSMVCEASLQEVPYQEDGQSYPGYIWASEDLICVVDAEDTKIAHISFADTYPLTSGKDYRLVLKVLNPNILTFEQTTWKLSTWEEDGTALDGSQIKSFVVNEAMEQFVFSNIQQNGGQPLPDTFSFKMQFPTGLDTGDKIVIKAPPGFILTDVCDSLEDGGWYLVEDGGPISGYNPLLDSTYDCTESELTISVAGPDEQLPSPNALLQFYIPLINPTSTPDPHKNFWCCTHLDASGDEEVILSSKAVDSWTIFPQIANVEFKLVGDLLAADATSSISLSFRPVSNAEDVLITVLEPSGFNFNNAQIADEDQEVVVRYGNAIRVQAAITAGNLAVFHLNNVKLGAGGGQTVITLTTYTGGLFQNGEWIVGERLDEISMFNQGFRLPGRLKVITEALENDFQRDSVVYPVESQWSVQMDQLAYAKFDFYVTQHAHIGTTLAISGTPYMPVLDPTKTSFELKKKQTVMATSSGASQAEVIPTNFHNIDANGTLRVTLQQPLLPNIIYNIEMSVRTPVPKEAEAVGVQNIEWMISTEDGGELPVNTNDGESRAFRIVEELEINVTSAFSPPTAEVTVSLAIKVGLYHPTELTVVAPLGFTFPADCLVYGGIEVLACNPGVPLAGRSTAVLQVTQAKLTYQPPDVRIKVNTPTVTPPSKEWFIEGTLVWSGVQACWGKAEGIEVMQMTGTSVSYPAIGTVQSRIMWTFTTQVVVDSGGYLELLLPDNFNPACGAGQLELLSFPSFCSCYVEPDQSTVIVLINTTIVPDSYVFAFYISPPVLTPPGELNKFSITLKDSEGAVMDAAIGVPGITMMDKLQVKEAPLHWTVSKPGWATDVTMGFDVLETFPDNFVAADQQVGQILLSFPEGFMHQVSSTADFTILSGSMPLPDDNWLDYYSKDRLLIKLHLNQTFWTTLVRGIYQFQIPILLPDQLPTYNVWHVSLCTMTTFPGECSKPTDPGVLVTFAIPGFAFGEGTGGAAGGSPHVAQISRAVMLLALIVPILLALRAEDSG